jgi:pantetheine-phosphate adenylyltransferase
MKEMPGRRSVFSLRMAADYRWKSFMHRTVQMKKVAVYPGSFDPITNGHIDIITRGLRMFDEMIILVAYNPNKSSLFTVEERMELVRTCLTGNNVRVDCSSGLLVDYVRSKGANVILRGLRAVSDFEYEFQMALINRRLNRDVETVFLMTGYQWFYTSSNLIKEAASLGGSVKGLVPDLVNERLQQLFGKAKE